MAVEISGMPEPANIESYSHVENATPLDPASNSGGFGQLSWAAQHWPRARLAVNTDVTLSDGFMGRTTAIIRNVSGDDVTVQFTADSELGKFNVVRVADAYSGPLSGLMQYYLDLCGIFTPLDYQAQDPKVDMPGFFGNVWDRIKQIMSAHQIEMALVFDRVTVRPIRMYEADTGRHSAKDFTVETQTSAIAVDVAYFNNRWINKGEVYPVPGEEPSVQTVEAGEVVEFEVNMHATLTRVYQPECVYQTGPENKSGTNGVYTVVGQDNLPIQPAQWLDNGGKLEVQLSNDPAVLIVRVQGANIPHLSPFRIAMSAGGTDYNSLHITGDGVAWDRQVVRLYTGADPLNTAEEVGITVENPYVSTKEQAYVTGAHTAAAYSGSQAHISGTAVSINREIHDKQPVAVQLRDVDLKLSEDGIVTMAQFNAAFAGQTLQEWGDQWEDLFVEVFANQVFGNVSGARVYRDGAYYRITEATVTPGSINYSAIMDTTIGDFNKAWEGVTVEEFNEVFAEQTLRQFSTMPLQRSLLE